MTRALALAFVGLMTGSVLVISSSSESVPFTDMVYCSDMVISTFPSPVSRKATSGIVPLMTEPPLAASIIRSVSFSVSPDRASLPTL